MDKLLFYHFRVANSRLKNKKFEFMLLTRSWKMESYISSYYLDVEKWKILLRVTNSKNINKILILTSFEISLLKWNIMQFRIIYKKCTHVGLWSQILILLSIGIVYDHDVTQHMQCVILLCYFLKESFCYHLVLLLVNMWYLYEY